MNVSQGTPQTERSDEPPKKKTQGKRGPDDSRVGATKSKIKIHGLQLLGNLSVSKSQFDFFEYAKSYGHSPFESRPSLQTTLCHRREKETRHTQKY